MSLEVRSSGKHFSKVVFSGKMLYCNPSIFAASFHILMNEPAIFCCSEGLQRDHQGVDCQCTRIYHCESRNVGFLEHQKWSCWWITKAPVHLSIALEVCPSGPNHQCPTRDRDLLAMFARGKESWESGLESHSYFENQMVVTRGQLAEELMLREDVITTSGNNEFIYLLWRKRELITPMSFSMTIVQINYSKGGPSFL